MKVTEILRRLTTAKETENALAVPEDLSVGGLMPVGGDISTALVEIQDLSCPYQMIGFSCEYGKALLLGSPFPVREDLGEEIGFTVLPVRLDHVICSSTADDGKWTRMAAIHDEYSLNTGWYIAYKPEHLLDTFPMAIFPIEEVLGIGDGMCENDLIGHFEAFAKEYGELSVPQVGYKRVHQEDAALYDYREGACFLYNADILLHSRGLHFALYPEKLAGWYSSRLKDDECYLVQGGKNTCSMDGVAVTDRLYILKKEVLQEVLFA